MSSSSYYTAHIYLQHAPETVLHENISIVFVFLMQKVIGISCDFLSR